MRERKRENGAGHFRESDSQTEGTLRKVLRSKSFETKTYTQGEDAGDISGNLKATRRESILPERL